LQKPHRIQSWYEGDSQEKGEIASFYFWQNSVKSLQKITLHSAKGEEKNEANLPFLKDSSL